ncbi:MAG: BlaI/MecI/CopY family transcriptional regulator [Eubacteriales bacterium]|nr:BlaI/MecI/CopY family transcriptional regulator [Eubacteriales bacterium]
MSRSMSPTEEIIMQCLWESGEDLTVYEITERLRTQYQRDYTNSAVATFMKSMLEKGMVTRFKVHHSYQWHPEIDMDEYRDRETDAFLDLWHHGSKSSMLASLLRDTDISEEELQEMRELLDEYSDQA